MAMHDDNEPLLTKSAREAWDCFLTEFDRDVWPMFAKRKFNRDTALIAFQLQRLTNQMVAVEDALAEGEE